MSEKWTLAGTYFEACNCDIACPCTFLSAPTEGECTAVAGWHINTGSFGNVTLNGLNVALSLHSPGHMLEVKWRAGLYLDSSASKEQMDVLTQIFTGQVGGHTAILISFVGEVLGIKSVPIEYEAIGKRRSLKVEGIIEAEVEAIQDQGGQDVSINNPPLGIAPGHTLVVAKSKKFTYKDHGLKWEISGKNGFYSPFTYQGG